MCVLQRSRRRPSRSSTSARIPEKNSQFVQHLSDCNDPPGHAVSKPTRSWIRQSWNSAAATDTSRSGWRRQQSRRAASVSLSARPSAARLAKACSRRTQSVRGAAQANPHGTWLWAVIPVRPHPTLALPDRPSRPQSTFLKCPVHRITLLNALFTKWPVTENACCRTTANKIFAKPGDNNVTARDSFCRNIQ